MEQQDIYKRLTIALVLSFFVAFGFSYLFPQKTPETQPQTQNEPVSAQTPAVATSSPAKATPAVHTKTAESAPVLTSSEKIIATVVSKKFKMSIDEFGRIAMFELQEKKYRDEDGKNHQIIGADKVKPLEIRFSDTNLNNEAFKTPYVNAGEEIVDVSTGAKSVLLTQKLSSLTVTKKITVEPNGAYRLEVITSTPSLYFITPGHRPMVDDSMYMLVRGALIKGGDGVIDTIEDEDAEGNEKYEDAKIASAFDRYVATMFYSFDKGMNVSVLKQVNGDPLIFVQGGESLVLNGYIGPKEYKILDAIHPELTDAIEFGWFTFLATPFFKVLLWINDIVGNWGWAIIIFTVLIKLVLFPLSYKGMMSMQKLKELAPKMKELKEKYGKDPAKMNAQMMEMYRKHGANPMGGCLPMLLQIPVFFALYRVLLNADELQGAAWFPVWITDLSKSDPYFILPVLMGVSMWYQQRITPTNFSDPMQEQIFKWFPVLIAGMFIIMPFPSGLVLYWVINNIFTIGQQYVINKAYNKQKNAAIAEKKGKES